MRIRWQQGNSGEKGVSASLAGMSEEWAWQHSLSLRARRPMAAIRWILLADS